MDPKLLLVKAITLLYRESQVAGATENSADLVRQIISTIKLPESTMDTDRGREVLVALRTTALWMADNPVAYEYDKGTLLQRIRVNVIDDDNLYNAFAEGLFDYPEQSQLKKVCLSYRDTLKTYLNRGSVKEIIKKASNKAMFAEDTIDWKHFVREIVAELEPFNGSNNSSDHASMVDNINLSDVNSVKEALGRSQNELAMDGVMRTGWQGVSRMLGQHGGHRRGEMTVVGALQHNFKSGFMLNILKHTALYNTPYMRDNSKIPLLLFVSFENSATDNLMWLYVNLKENETGEACDVQNVNLEEAAAYVSERMERNGYKIKMLRIDPSDYTFHDMFDLVKSLEAEGYEIHQFICDYLNMMSKKGTSGGANGADIRDLFRRVRNFMSPRGINFITPHQLSPDAKALVRMGVEDFVKEVANKGYWDSCKAIDQEVDLEIIIHIVKINGESFLTIQRGKHRKVQITLEKDLYTVLKFSPIGGIRDDVNGPDTSLTRPGGRTQAEGGGAAWWDNEAA